jgi:hypothetical protein
VGSAHLRIVFPVKVSVSRIGQAQRGTWAFAEQDVQVPRTERRALSAAAKAFWANKSRDTGRAYLGALGKIVLRFKEVARRSEYYLKLYSPERQRIVQTLLASGVPVEQPIEVYPKYSLRTPNTRSGTPPRYRLRRIPYSRTVALFAREDYENLVTADKIDTASVCAQIRGICTGMHNAGVAHNDADLWNFVVNPRGHVKVVDLGKSRRYLQPPRTQAEFIKRYGKDLWMTANAIQYLEQYPDRTERRFKSAYPVVLQNLEKEIDRMLETDHMAQRLGVTGKRIVQYKVPDYR